MGKEQQQEITKPGTGSLLIYINLPPPGHAKKYDNSPVLLRHFVAHRLRKMLWANKKLKEKALSGCSCNALPAYGKKKDGETYLTGMPGHIQIHKYDQPEAISECNEVNVSHAYMGMQRCGSALRCPVCGARIRFVRRGEIQQITKKMFSMGYSFIFQTLTAPHYFSSDPKEFVKLFQEANRFMKQGRQWKLFTERWKLDHYIRAVEATDDRPGSKKKSGIHFHSHSIIFLKRQFLSEKEAKKFRDELAKLWCNALIKAGLITEADREKTFTHGTDVERPKVANQGELSDPELIEKLIEYVCKGASFEMSPGTINGKEGRKKDRITHWELMRLALLENKLLQGRLIAILQALKGIAHLQFSRGLKDLCCIEEVSDKEIVEGKAETLVYAFDSIDKKNLWKGIKRYGHQKPLLVALDESSTVPTEFLVDTAAGGAVDVITGELLE